ncbi:MAG: NAD(P)/FAD-dependent oxidoreductase [Thermoplasmatales archaeon]|nr:MAG: NAD(P)/FAD-dependent oxidoreductase [Thermoplasmatales archaeon]
MSIKCDVLVVGGGPAGSSAARSAAKNGAKTILIEEHEEIGVPIQCAEGIGKYLIPFLPFKIPKEQLKWEIKGMTFWADDVLIERNGGIWSGHTINRKEWDKWLAGLAVKEGAQIKTNSKLIGLDYSDNFAIKKAIVKSNNKKIEIMPKILIAADGVNSTVVDLLEIKNNSKNVYVDVKSFEMKNLQLSHPHHDQVFVGDFAPNAYSYIFPITKSRANIGVGLYNSSKKIDTMYEKFLEIPVVKKQLKSGVTIIKKDGTAPLKCHTDNWAYGNVLLAGDAANQNMKPFIEGNIPSIICGNIAGKISANSIKNKQDINEYETSIDEILGPFFKSSDELLEIMLEALSSKNQDFLNLIIGSNIYSLKKVKQLFNTNKDEIQKKIDYWRKSKFKQYSTKFIERYYLFYLFLWRKSRLL